MRVAPQSAEGSPPQDDFIKVNFEARVNANQRRIILDFVAKVQDWLFMWLVLECWNDKRQWEQIGL